MEHHRIDKDCAAIIDGSVIKSPYVKFDFNRLKKNKQKTVNDAVIFDENKKELSEKTKKVSVSESYTRRDINELIDLEISFREPDWDRIIELGELGKLFLPKR